LQKENKKCIVFLDVALTAFRYLGAGWVGESLIKIIELSGNLEVTDISQIFSVDYFFSSQIIQR